jgi:hypothetical protein
MEPGIAISMIITLAAIGAFLSFIARFNQKYNRGWKSTLRILFTDYVLEDYASLTLLSLVYSLGAGGLGGASIGAFIYSIFASSDNQTIFFGGVLMLLLIPLLRISVEGYSVIYKTAQNASRFFDASTADLLKRDPSLSRVNPWTENEQRIKADFGYSKNEIFEAILEELKEIGVDISLISRRDTSFSKNRVVVTNNLGHQVAVFTRHEDGEWTRDKMP